MDVLQDKMRSRVSSLQEQAVENSDTASAYFEEESDELKELGSARAIRFIKKRKNFVIAFLLIAAIGYGVYGKYFNLTDAEIAQKELAIATGAVGELMILPEGDEPVLATVTDAEALAKQQAFFTGAINGDQLLLFPKNMKAVIYSPSRNKIINAGPIEQQAQAPNQESGIVNQEEQTHTTENQQGSASIPQKSAPLSVEVRNGTDVMRLAAQVADTLQRNGYAVVKVADASEKNRSKTVVVSFAKGGAHGQKVGELAASLGAEVVTELPPSEEGTSADVLVILGRE